MTYTVIWKHAAEEELARIWMDAEDRDSVTKAADEIDKLLGTNPLDQGESRSGAVRVLFVDPLGIFFHIDDEDRLVSVLKAWWVA
jgi:plasmid stabilization system protein ParE